MSGAEGATSEGAQQPSDRKTKERSNRDAFKDPITMQDQPRPANVKDEDFHTAITKVAQSRSTDQVTHNYRDENSPANPYEPTSALGNFPFAYDGREFAPISRTGTKLKAWTIFIFSIWATLSFAISPSFKVIFLALVALFIIIIGAHLAKRQIDTAISQIEASLWEGRGQRIQQAEWPESLEWFNSLFAGIWARIPAESFESVADMLEDTIQANLPRMISEVKCAELTQGKNSLKILSARLLPLSQEDEEEKRMNGGVAKHVNIELALAYRAKERHKGTSEPTQGDAKKIGPQDDNVTQAEGFFGTKNTPLMGQGPAHDARILFLFQVKMGPTSMQLPVKVLLNGFVGIARVRIELTSAPPFLGGMQLSFQGLPKVSVDIIPLSLSLSNVPGLAGLIQGSIDSALQMYTTPSTLNVNIGEALIGDGIKREAESPGVVLVTVHSAQNLERADLKGLSDPYARITWARTASSTVHATRVITTELNPIWEQSFALLVNPQVWASVEAAKASNAESEGEAVCVEIWDSDAPSEDDFLGKANIPFDELSLQKGKMITKEDELSGLQNGEKKGGIIRWSIGYFEKFATEKLAEDQKDDHTNQSNEIDQSAEELDKQGQTNAATAEREKSAVERYPPSRERPIGILCLQIKTISGLRLKERAGNHKEGGEDEEAPSSYVEVILADRRVYKSRTKMDDAEPCFNAVTEQVCDWTTASCLFVVRENEVAGKDDILGVVAVKLSDVFENSSLITRTYPIAGGYGTGRLQLSLLFRSLDLHLAHLDVPTRLVPSVGILRIYKIEIQSDNSESGKSRFEGVSIKLATLSTKKHISASASCVGDTHNVSWELGPRKAKRLPVYRRDASALVVTLKGKRSVTGRRKSVGVAVLWLNQVPDRVKGEQGPRDATFTFAVNVWNIKGDDEKLKKLSRNWISHDDQETPKNIGCELIGRVQLQLDFCPGISSLHGGASKMAGDAKKVFESWKAAASAGIAPLSDSSVDQSCAIEDQSDSSSSASSDSSDEEESNDQDRTSFLGFDRSMERSASGSKSQFFRRLAKEKDGRGTHLKDDLLHGLNKVKTRFETDGDKTRGIEREV